MEKGDIVYFNKLKLYNNAIDKKVARPCVVLYQEERESGNYICCVPLTSQVKQLNKFPENTFFVPDIVYNSKKLNFVKLNCAFVAKEEEAIQTILKLDDSTVNNILNRILKYTPKYQQKKEYKHIKLIITYIKLFDELEKREEMHNKKQEKTLKKQYLKGKTQKVLTNNA